MSEEVYVKLGETMARRGIAGHPTGVPEYIEMLKVLFTVDEAEIHNAMPPGRFTPDIIAGNTGKSEEEVTAILEDMADKGLCTSHVREGVRYYVGPPLLPGIIEFQFMRGTITDRDRQIALAIHKYRKAITGNRVPRGFSYPRTRVIPINRNINAGVAVQTFDQVISYIENSDPIAVSTCYCRHEALLIDGNDVCGAPNEVCMQFNTGAEYLIERKLGRRVSKKEAREIMLQAEEAGLVHASSNTQKIEFICNCCPCHCGILQAVLNQPRPADAILHGFEPSFDPVLCTMCGDCVDRCPIHALILGEGETPEWQEVLCIGCGVCASGCDQEAIMLVEKDGDNVPPLDMKALGETILQKRSARKDL